MTGTRQLTLICLAAFLAVPALRAQFGPETCKAGFVWREACGPNDHICVTVDTRTQAAQDNSQAAARRDPNGGAFGVDSCRQGFVWREACGPQDHVCVLPAARTQAAQDNAQASSRFQSTPVLWDVLTQHNDTARSGAQLHETILNPSNVTPNTFGRLYERHVSGQIIAQPLYESNQSIPGAGLHNVVYVATRENRIYAFDADDTDPDPTHGLIWTSPVLTEPAGPVPHMCTETVGPMGITSTPVIDRATDTMYVVARKSDGTIWLNALDIATGQPKSGTPGAVQIKASIVNSNGMTINFNQNLELSRAALLFSNGAIYMGFSALNCDNQGWRGWILQYRAPDLQQVGAFVTVMSNNGQGGGVWQSGNGLMAVNDGNIYFNTGNGSVNGSTDLGESFVKLHSGPPPTYGLSLAGHYTVSNFAALNGGDTDLGAGGSTLLPGGRLVGGGKQGKLYVFNTATMQLSQNPASGGAVPPGGSDGFQAFINTWHDNTNEVECTQAPMPGRKCFMPHPNYELGEVNGPNIHTGPIYWDGANTSFGLLYGMPEKDFLRAFRYDHSSHELSTTPFAVSSLRSPDGMPGSSLSLSANGNSGGIIWASMPKMDGQYVNVPGRLVAFDALTLKEIWRDDDNMGFPKFTSPTVAGGKIFRPTFADKLIVYGLKSGPDQDPCYNIAQKYENYTGQNGMLGQVTTPESTAPDGVGHFEHFQGGSIYWTPSTCAHEVHGSIRGLWQNLGWERSILGYPVTDETVTPDGIGRYNHFQNGSIYWTPLTGAHEVHGLIRGQWAKLGWEQSSLGYPISDETDEVDGSGRFSLFEHGSIHWSRQSNAVIVLSSSGVLNGPLQANTDRPGSDLPNMPIHLPANATPAMCQQQCADNTQCRAWTFVNAGLQGPQANCWLKSTAPIQQASTCCTSGIKVDIHPANMRAVQGATDRPGSDLTNFDLPSADYHLCQGECSLNSGCAAWAYVEPNTTQGPNPRCWLKSASPGPIHSGCCVSGTK